jgi:peptide/nickel transport system substrate-binding protein
MSKALRLLIILLVVAGGLLIWNPWKQTLPSAASKTLRYAFEVETATLDPSRITDAYASRMMGQVFEGLVTLDEKNEVVPCLAEKWRFEQDGKRWIFTLRGGVSFHPDPIFGQAGTRTVDSQDVEFSFTRLLGPGATSGYAIDGVLEGAAAFSKGEAKKISGIQPMGAKEIAFDLLAPDPLFPRRLSSVILGILPREAGSLSGGKVFGRDVIVGTGPFRVISRTDTAVDLARNDTYWRPVVGNVEKIEIKVIKNDALRLDAARNGDVDLTYVPLLLAPTVAEADSNGFRLKQGWKDARLEVSRTFNSTFLGLNCERLDAPFRRALNQAVDRQALIKLFLPGTVLPSLGPVPLALAGYKEPDDAAHPPDIAGAKQSFEASTNRSRPIEILVHDKEASEQVGQLLQAQFKAAGVDVHLTKLEYGAVLQRMAAGDYDAFLMSFEYVYSTPMPILEGLLNSKRIPSPNFWRYRNADVDAALEEFQRVTSVDAGNQLAARIVGMIQSDPPAVYLYQTLTPIIVSDRLGEVHVNGHSVPMLWAVKIK